jgi:hypothetical protein
MLTPPFLLIASKYQASSKQASRVRQAETFVNLLPF